ncbi:MAG: DUF1566 domain-containing protein [Candidatus Hydrogenedentes bacterium]|nr:DUF1566 domain-containing protein [Candidatus Hydrogenedentota bacterium]
MTSTTRPSAPTPPTLPRRLLGWIAVLASTLIAGYWALWGSIETFHEGWYYDSLLKNIALSLGQYMMPSLVFVLAACIAIRWSRIGALLHFTAAVFAAWFFRNAAPIVIYPFIVGPLTLMALAYWFGRPHPRKLAVLGVVVIPALVALVSGSGHAWRVAHRIDDGDRSARRITQNGVDLIWAPAGPGWPMRGTTWEDAKHTCAYLNADGLTLADAPQNIWRLPTVEEAARSMQLHGQDAGGSWDPATHRTSYKMPPDKESPLWDTRSQVIYWWTADSIDDKRAYMIVYDGQAWPRPKDANWGYLAYRAVKSP